MMGDLTSGLRLDRNRGFILFVLVILTVLAFTPTASVGQSLPGDDIVSFRNVDTKYDAKSFWQWNYRFEIDYTCNPNRGSVIVGAYFAPIGNGLLSGHSYWGDSPVVENRTSNLIRGRQKVNVAVHLDDGVHERTTTMLKIFLYEPNQREFFTRPYYFTLVWRRR